MWIIGCRPLQLVDLSHCEFDPELFSHSAYVRIFVTFATKWDNFWHRKWIDREEKKRKWGNVESETLSSFSLYFLFIFSFSLHFLVAWLPAATICETLIGCSILKRTMLSKSVKKRMEFMKVTKMDVKADLLLVGWFFPLGESSRFSTRQLLCHKYAEGAAGNILFCQFHNTRGKHCRIPNTTSAIQQHLMRTTRGAPRVKVSKMWNSRVCLVQCTMCTL